MTMKERSYLRRLQDRLIKKLVLKGAGATTELPFGLTIRALRGYIFPELANDFRDFLKGETQWIKKPLTD